MSADRNRDVKEALSQEIKILKGRCADAINIIENAPLEHGVTPENVTEKSLCYVEGLRAELQNSHTPIPTDQYLLTAEFLKEMQERKKQTNELVAFTKGAICDVDREIERLTSHLKVAEEAQAYAPQQHLEVTAEHLEAAKQHFHTMQTQLFGLIQSLFPNHYEDMKNILAELMQAHMSVDPNQSKYICVTDQTLPMMEMLLGLNLVTPNPYDNTEFKLAY